MPPASSQAGRLWLYFLVPLWTKWKKIIIIRLINAATIFEWYEQKRAFACFRDIQMNDFSLCDPGDWIEKCKWIENANFGPFILWIIITYSFHILIKRRVYKFVLALWRLYKEAAIDDFIYCAISSISDNSYYRRHNISRIKLFHCIFNNASDDSMNTNVVSFHLCEFWLNSVISIQFPYKYLMQRKCPSG